MSTVSEVALECFYSMRFETIKLKDTCYGCGKNSQNQQLLDILACNSANRPNSGAKPQMSQCYAPHILSPTVQGTVLTKFHCKVAT